MITCACATASPQKRQKNATEFDYPATKKRGIGPYVSMEAGIADLHLEQLDKYLGKEHGLDGGD
jgi:hypothetical protein